MKTHMRQDNEGNTLLYPGKLLKNRSLFPYDYKVFDTRFDRIEDLYEDPLISEAEQGHLIAYLDRLPSYDSEKIEFALEEMIERNGGRKPRITLLLDNSGSTRGEPNTHIVRLSDAIGLACDNLGIPLEILGNTTVKWKGGDTRQEWLNEGRPPSPGRLNDVRHIIYKDREHSFADSRTNLGLMLKDGLLKENLDGEAIEWAYQRIYDANESGNILLHIADGAPVDDSTLSVNPADFLEKHYHQATAFVQGRPDTNIYAIGVGYKNTKGVFDGSVDVTSGYDEANFGTICNAIAGMDIPSVLPQEGVSVGTRGLTTTTTDTIKQLLELFGEQSTIISHNNFFLLSEELKRSIYDFFIENSSEIPKELRSTIMNFVLEGNLEEIGRKMEVVFDMDFLAKWILWNEKVGYRTLEEFYVEDYIDSVKDANIVTFSSFIDGYKLHGTVVFKILNYLLKIDDQDFCSRLTHHIATQSIVDDMFAEKILEGLKDCNNSTMIEYYHGLDSDEKKDDFVVQLLRVLSDMVNILSFDAITFCVLHKAGIEKAYGLELKRFFNPNGLANIQKPQKILDGVPSLGMVNIDKHLLDMDSVHVWEYFTKRYDIFIREMRLGKPFEAVSNFEDTDEIDTKELNAKVKDFQDQKLFLQFFLRDECIETINQLPPEVFASLMKNRDVFSFTKTLRSGEFLVLQPYFSNPYFLSIISDTRDTLNKQVYDYLMFQAKKGKIVDLDENFFELDEVQKYLQEKADIEKIMSWLQNPQEYTPSLLQGLRYLVSQSELFESKSIGVAFTSQNKKHSFQGLEAIHMLIKQIVFDVNLLNDRKTLKTSQDILKDVCDLFQATLQEKDRILSSYSGDMKKSYGEMFEMIEKYIERISEYHQIFLNAEMKSLPIESSEKEEYNSNFKDIRSFLSISKHDFSVVYSGYIRKYGKSSSREEQEIFQKLNVMRDLFRKIRGW